MNLLNYVKKILLPLVFAAIGLVIAGCGPGKEGNRQASSSAFDGSKFLAKAEIPGAMDVSKARKSSENQQEITVVGRIGGSLDPWVKGLAAFSIVDRSLIACSDETPEGEACSCETPWDYCCATDQLKDAMALVKFVEADGKIVRHDAREIFGISELQTVIVKGKAERDKAGNLTILASQMYLDN